MGASLIVGVLPLSLAGFVARWSALAEITTHFRVLYALAASAALLLLLAGRRWRWAAAAALLLAWHAAAIAPWYLPAAGVSEPSGTVIRVLTINVNADNEQYDRLIALIDSEKPDVIFIQELSPGWAAALEALRTEYPHNVITARTDYFGLGLYSRYPLEKVRTEDPVNSDVPVIRADALVDGRRVHLINVHLAPPEGGELTRLRYKQYEWMNSYVASLDGPLIAAGDFNCTMWSPLYRNLVREGRLVNARQGHGILASWFPIAGPLHAIPIDQVLGGGVRFTGAHLGARIGSDHCPLVAELRLP